MTAKVINNALFKLKMLNDALFIYKNKIGTKPYGCVLFLFKIIGR